MNNHTILLHLATLLPHQHPLSRTVKPSSHSSFSPPDDILYNHVCTDSCVVYRIHKATE